MAKHKLYDMHSHLHHNEHNHFIVHVNRLYNMHTNKHNQMTMQTRKAYSYA